MSSTRSARAGALTALAAVGILGPAGAGEFLLVEDSRAVVEIVYDDTPSDDPTPAAEQRARMRESIEDFRGILGRVSGADVPARTVAEAGERDAAGTIQVGATPAARRAGLVDRVAKLPPHSLLVHADPDGRILYLLGSTLEGSSHAIYEFLERLGCRWYMPGTFGEELPSLPTIAVTTLDLVRQPAFELRTFQLGAVGSVKAGTPGRREFTDWMRRNKFGGWQPPRGHAFPSLVPRKQYFQEHPEYYALRDGVRTPTHLCMTNPGTVAAAERHLVEYFTHHPQAHGFPVALTDGVHYCECPDCTAACGGDPTRIVNLYLTFTRDLFDRVDKHFPGREFRYGVYVYANLLDVPDVAVPRQLAPFMAPLGEDCLHEIADPRLYSTLSVTRDFPASTLRRIEDSPRGESALFVERLMTAWGKGSDNIYIRDYDPYMVFGQNMPIVRAYQLAIELPWYRSVGVRGFTPEAVANSWFSSGINYYVRSRLYWDLHADMKGLMQEYCRGMFGRAWEPMYWFLDALARRTIETAETRPGDESLTRVYSVEWVRGLDEYLDEAEALAATPKERDRVAMWRLCQRHMLGYLATRNAELEGDFAGAARLARDYLRLLDEIHAVNRHFVEPRWYEGREFSMPKRLEQYEQLAGLLDGTEGSLLARLPAAWQFRHDPDDVGVGERWFEFAPSADPAAAPPAGWRLRCTHDSWQTRGAEYRGYNWYRTQALVPADARGKPVRMLVAGIFGHMDFFVNGRRVTWPAHGLDESGRMIRREVAHLDLAEPWSWNYDRSFDVDISEHLVFDAPNTFAFRTRDKHRWGGIFKTVTLFVPSGERLPVFDPLIPRPPIAAPDQVAATTPAIAAAGAAAPTMVAARSAEKTGNPKPAKPAVTVDEILRRTGSCDCSHTTRGRIPAPFRSAGEERPR